MKRIAVVLMALCFAPLLVQAQDEAKPDEDLYHTCNKTNGRWWNLAMKADDTAASVYLMAVMDTYTDWGLIKYWPDGATIGEIRDLMTKFYEDPANVQIPIVDAIGVMKGRINGNPAKVLDIETRVLRTFATSCPTREELGKKMLEEVDKDVDKDAKEKEKQKGKQ
jgi:hypothetical protein